MFSPERRLGAAAPVRKVGWVSRPERCLSRPAREGRVCPYAQTRRDPYRVRTLSREYVPPPLKYTKNPWITLVSAGADPEQFAAADRLFRSTV